MRLIFVKLKHIGDSLVLTPTLTAVKAAYPQAEIHVVVRRGCQGILDGCPAIDFIHTSAPPEKNNRSRMDWWNYLTLLARLRRLQADYAFELSDGNRARNLVLLSGAKKRCADVRGIRFEGLWRKTFNALTQYRFIGDSGHRVEKDYYTVNEFLPLPKEIPPLVFDRSRTVPWTPAEGMSDYVVFHPGTRWLRKRWPVEKWIELGNRLLNHVAHLIISAGPDTEETDAARKIQQALGSRVISTDGKTSWAQLAGLLYNAKLFVGVDTAAMHLAAACQSPIVAIFGDTVISQWRPWRVRHRLVTAPQEKMREVRPEHLAQQVRVEDMEAACLELLSNPNHQ